MHTLVIGILTVLLYMAAAILLGNRFKNRDTSKKWKGLIPACIAVVLHGWLLASQVFTATGIDLGIFNAISAVAWFISTLLVLSAFVRATENLGIIVFPGAGLAIALELNFSTSHITDTLGSTLEIHIVISIAAYALLSMAAVQALILTVQDNFLRNKRPGGLIRTLPPLQTMETFLFKLISTGFILQCLSLVSGFIFLENMFAQHLVHKTILSLIGWGVFGTLLWGRWQFGWRGKTAIRWTLIGFAFLALAYLGSKVVLELILQQPTI